MGLSQTIFVHPFFLSLADMQETALLDRQLHFLLVGRCLVSRTSLVREQPVSRVPGLPHRAIGQIAALARALAAVLPELGILGPHRATMLPALLGAAPDRALLDPLPPALFRGRAAGSGGFPGTHAIPALDTREEAAFRASLHPPCAASPGSACWVHASPYGGTAGP